MLSGSKAWSLIQPLLGVATDHGIEAPRLRSWLGGVSPPEALPIASVLELWANVASACRDPELPLRGARRLRIEDLSVMGLATLAAPTGHAALEQALRALPLVASGGQWRAERVQDLLRVDWIRGGERWLGHRLANESGVASFVACLRQVLGEDVAPSRVSFRHAAPACSAAHRDYFRCRVEYGAERDGFELPWEALSRAPRLANPALAAHLRAEAEARLRLRAPERLSPEVRAEIEYQLSAGAEVTSSGVAGALGLSERTLRRRLLAEGTSFRALACEGRAEAAEVLLRHTALSVTDIALQVGFADSAALAHALRRRFGCSARQLRRQARSSARI